MPSFIRAVLTILLALLLFDIMGAIVKFLVRTYPVEQLSFLRNLFGAVPSAVMLLMSNEWRAAGRPVKIRQWKLGLGRGLMITFAQMCFYTSLMHMEFATATTIGFSAPLFITTLTVPLLGGRVGPWRWIAVLIGFTGILWIVQPGSDVFTWYGFLPLAAAAAYGCAAVLIRRFDADVPSPMINLYTTMAAMSGSAVLMLSTGRFTSIVSVSDWLWILGMGLSGGLAIILLIAAYRLTRPSNLAPFEYFGIIFPFILGWVFFGEAPFDRLIPGVFLIVGGGLLVVWRERVNARREVPARQIDALK